MAARLKEKFDSEVCKKCSEDFGIKNPMALPRLEKIVINVGMGKSLEGTKLNPGHREQVIRDLTVISGQRPVMIRAKKSVANFKVREGFESACMVTMRGARMWEFCDRLISIAIPRIKDFRGLPDKSFDRQGNYSFGVTEQGIFPEVDIANATFMHGMNINFTFRNSNPEKSRAVLAYLGIPFVKPDDQRAGRRGR